MTTDLVGRERALAVLESAVRELQDGRGSAVIVVGEAGIGKTALTAAMLEIAASAGAITAVGSSWEGAGSPQLWHWMQIVRACVRTDAGQHARAAVGPGLDVVLGESTDATMQPGTQAEFRTFDAVASFIERVADATPTVVVLEDLHWADPRTIRAAEFVVRHRALTPLLLLATHRPPVPGDPTEQPLSDLAGASRVLALSGLDASSAAELFTRSGGDELDDDEAAELHRRTGGNPFFVTQAAFLRAAGIVLQPSAPGVREVLGQRFDAVSSSTRVVLRVAAVLGRQFDRDLLAEVSDASPATVRTAIAESIAAGLVVPVPGTRAEFVHDLVREALLEELPDHAERAVRAAATLALRNRGRVGSEAGFFAAVAEHAVRASPELADDVVIDALLAAADDARARQSADEEAEHLHRALRLAPARSDLAVRLGSALVKRGQLAEAHELYRGLVDRSRAGAEAVTFAEAVLGLHAVGTAIEGTVSLVDLLDEASAMLADEGGELAVTARVRAAQTRALAHTVGEDRDRALTLGREAVALARRLGDDAVLGTCLHALHDSIWDVDTGAARLAILSEMTAVAQRLGDTELTLQAGHLRVAALLELGRPEARGEDRAAAALARWMRLPRQRYLAMVRETAFATIDGDFDRAADLIDEAHALATALAEPDRNGLAMDQRFEIAIHRGRPDDVADELARARLEGDPHVVLLEAACALARGDREGAAEHLPAIEALGRVWPRWGRSVWLVMAARLAVGTGDDEEIGRARADIEPFLDRWVVLGGTILVSGPFSYWYGLTSRALGDLDVAVTSFRAAAAAARRLASPVWRAWADIELVETLLERDGVDDRSEASELVAALRSEPVVARMKQVVDRLAVAGMPTGAPPEQPARERTGREKVRAAGNVFRRDGEVWTLTFRGETLRMAGTKGLGDLHELISNVGVEIPAIDLLHRGDGDVAAARRSLGADEMLDDAARQAYRARLDELDERIEQALARSDDDRAADLDRERDALVAELSRASGLGGRRRRLGDEAEKARKTVTARIRDTLRKLDGSHPALAAHLRDSVTTGTRCRYDAADAITWDL